MTITENKDKNGKRRIKDGKLGWIVKVNWTDHSKPNPSQQLKRAIYGTKKEAEQFGYELLKKYANNDTFNENITVSQLVNEYLETVNAEVKAESKALTTYTNKKGILQNYILNKFNKVILSKLSARALQDWKNEINMKDISYYTKRDVYSEFRALLNYAIKMEYIPTNPLLKVGNFTKPIGAKGKIQFYTPEEFKPFLQAAQDECKKIELEKNDINEWNFYVFFNIAIFTGMRKGEILGLKWSDLNDNIFHIERCVNQRLPKGLNRETRTKNESSIRDIEISKQLIEILDEHKKRQQQFSFFSEDDYIISNEFVTHDRLRNRNKKYAKLAGVERIRIHDFRHTHASLLINAGVNIQEVARRLGHSNIKTTLDTYTHLYPKEKEKAVEILNLI